MEVQLRVQHFNVNFFFNVNKCAFCEDLDLICIVSSITSVNDRGQ